MPAVKTKRISTLIESQLPEFITTEYELFGKFIQKYYEQQEVQGGTLDVINNIQKYADIDFYEKNLLKEYDSLASSITNSSETITLVDASSFPKKNGYVKIDNEIIFYESRNETELLNCSRGVSGNTTLGDLYSSSNFTSTDAAPHNTGKKVYNVSNLFLYAFVKNFESQYLGSFPEKYLKGSVDKRTLIKNIQKFYKAKGTTSSIKFIFNTIVAKDIDNKPEVYKPRDFTYKTSSSDWTSIYALKVKVVSGDPKTLIGKRVVQEATEDYGYAFATVDNVFAEGTVDNEVILNIVLAPETVSGIFGVSTKTKLERSVSDSYGSGDKIDVFSTLGWDTIGEILIGEEVIKFSDKNINQFEIKERGELPLNYDAGTPVYKPVIIEGSGVRLLILGIVYNVSPKETQPYSYTGDKIQVSNPGFVTADPKIVKTGTNVSRWILNDWQPVSASTNIAVQNSLDSIPTNVSAIFEDDQYYYITSSGYPSYNILDRSEASESTIDQKLLRIIRKQATTTTEIYETPKADVGILLNGVRLYGYRDTESVYFGKLQEIKVNTRGRNYVNPPYVIIDGVINRARAVLTGNVVDSIIVQTTDTFLITPKIEISSGRDAKARAIVTRGEVTSIVVENPGKYYSSPPRVIIRDPAGRGRFAEYVSTINDAGEVSGFEKLSGGTLYNQDTIQVDIVAVGEGATATPLLKEWNKNRYYKYQQKLDSQYGYLFENYNPSFLYGYGQLANPKKLRVQLNDNLNSADTEPATKLHSPILGFAYDGNPIYGPFGYEDPLNASSSITRMTSSYSLNSNREDGPAVSNYPLGSFIDDYKYNHRSGSLDENNGRFCVTPDFPDGTYAYFITINSDQVPQFPYIIGEKFYSLPVDSNYNSNINQNDIPRNSKRYSVPGMPRNGDGLVASIAEVTPGSVSSFSIDRSSGNFSVNSKLYFDNSNTEGRDIEALVSEVKGKDVQYLQSKEDKVVKLTTIQNAYLFEDDILRQPASGASGQIVGTVRDDNVIVLKNVNGTFNSTGTFSADIKTFTLTIDQDSNYTKGATLRLTDGINPPIATAEILEGTNRQNIVKIKVLSGTWIVDDDYFLQSDDLFNTSGSKIVTLLSLSDNLEPFDVNQRVALIETSENHGLAIGDEVNISIFPNDTQKTKTYYLRKRLYQKVVFRTPQVSSSIDYNGVGRTTILNSGADYTTGTYTNIPLTGGSGSGATAVVTVSGAGLVSNIQIQDGGSGYRRGDFLSVDDDQLERSGASLSSSRLVVYVDHAGISESSTRMILKSSNGFVNGDLLSVGSEIVKIVSINGNEVTVDRAQEGTESVDLFDKQAVSLYKPGYNFSDQYQISTSPGTGYVKDYNQETQTATIVYDYSINKKSAVQLENSSTFFDSSTPGRLVSINSAEEVEFKFEFSEDNLTFIPNPNIDIQEFYKYVFDTSHSSLTGTYFDLSPSKSFNLLTLEKTASLTLPGNTGSFTEVKFGFGSRLSQNDYSTKTGTNFLNFYYFDKNNVVDSDGAYLKIIDDPLQGIKTINYVTTTRFVYDISAEPLWDGSGTIQYTTKGQFAFGEIENINIVNRGENYKKLPLVLGAEPSKNFKGSATVLFDTNTNVITGVKINEIGSNYVNPIVFVTDADGSGAIFKVVQRNGSLFSITVENPGRGYTYAPSIEIIESDTEIYSESLDIGIPQSVSITNNGAAYHLDKTVDSVVSSLYTVSLTNFNGEYQKGETVSQTIDGVKVLTAKVSEYRQGSNLLKLESVEGIIRENILIVGKVSNASGTVKSVYASTFSTEIRSFFDNLGYYTSDKGRLGVSNQKLTDSFFYQDYSYVVKSKTSIEEWRDLIKSTTHPSGFKLFGQVDVETSADTQMPNSGEKEASSFSIIQLWDPNKNKITVESTKQVTTQTIQSVEQYNVKTGNGSAATSEFNFNESRAFEFTLAAPFDGYYDTDGRLQGTTSFQVLDDNGNPFTPISAESLIVTLDGVLQEPGVAYTVSQDNIIFSNPPLGNNVKLTGNSGTDTTSYNGVTFIGRTFYFKQNQYNSRYIRKIRNIFQRNGRWIDSANQIERNTQFIVDEAVGYGKQYYPSLDWSTRLDDYQIDIEYILESYQHDLRFGGNTKTVDYSNIFTTSDYITSNKTESLDIFNYATKLAKLAIRNWDYIDYNVSYIQGSKQVTVSSTENLVIGMHISSGRAFDPDTKIVSIDSISQVTLSKPALVNSGAGAGGASAGITDVSTENVTGNTSAPTSTVRVELGETFSVQGDYVVPLSFSGVDSATFYLSAINNGTFYDASNIISNNKQFIIEKVVDTVYSVYPSIQGLTETKCRRDIGLFIDAIVYQLRFGGNEKVVEYSRLYWTNVGYPYGEELTNLGSNLEITATLFAWDILAINLTTAMRQEFNGQSINGIDFITDTTIAVDTQFPYCQEVASAIQSLTSVMKDIINNGPGAVDPTPANQNKSGQWTNITTYSNYNIIDDPLLPEQECEDVISSVNSLYENLSNILNDITITRTLPDYIDGETKEFELYWEDGSEVVTEQDENILLTINAVLQETKFNELYPGQDSYYIDRTVSPNKLVFDVPPIWDQYEGAKTLGEPTAVEKVVGTGIGNYKRLTIDENLIDNQRKGPFLILDLEDLTVQNIEQNDNLLVFVDSVLQKEGTSYEVVGPNIYFTFSITDQMKVDLRYLYGRDVGQILNIYNYNLDLYYAQSVVTLNTISGIDNFLGYTWMGDKIGSRIHAFQIKSDNTYNIIGEVSNFYKSGNTLTFNCFGNKSEIDETLGLVYFSVAGRYDSIFTTITLAPSGSSIDYQKDADSNLLLSGTDQNWRGTILRKTFKTPFVSLSNNSLIKVDGENEFRRIKELPSVLTSSEQRSGEYVSGSYYGQVNVDSYNGVTRGEGLSIVAFIENGSVVRLEWNQRSYDPITQPTAYQYYTPPVINFISTNGAGGGARARVIVSKGQVLSVELTNGGSGYTEAPQVIVARNYKVLQENNAAVSLIDLKLNIKQSLGLNVISTVSVLGNQVSGINTFTSILFDSPTDTDRVITSILTPEEKEVSSNLNVDLVQHWSIVENQRSPEVFETTHQATVLTREISTPANLLNIFSESRSLRMATSKEITTTVHNIIQNNSLSNINYFEVAAVLQVEADPTDTIIYIADTSKFKSNGFLLIGTEVVRYMRKVNDRFLMVQRGQNNTTAQFWAAGTFIRQIPDPVSIAPVGVVAVESQSQIATINIAGGIVSAGQSQKQVVTPPATIQNTYRNIVAEIQVESNIQSISNIETQVNYKLETGLTGVRSFNTKHEQTTVDTEIQSIISQFNVQKNHLQVLIFTPPSGAIDEYEENVFIQNPIKTRLNGFVTITEPIEVLKRNLDLVDVNNFIVGKYFEYIGNYIKTNAGHTIGHFDGIFDDGAANVSGLSILQLSTYYPALAIRDFSERSSSSYTLSGAKFTLMPPSIQNPVAISSSSGTIGGPIVVQDTTYFPDEGYLFSSSGTVIQYTGKTNTSFTGCTLVSGPNSININDEFVPYTIS
jgi:hypothetical protein